MGSRQGCTPPGMKAGKAPGILNNPHLRPLSLKLGERDTEALPECARYSCQLPA
jgi:hypothetical protein